MVAQRLERMVGRVRKWRSTSSADPLTAPIRVAPDLPSADVGQLRQVIDDCLTARGGEIAARRRATAIGATFLTLNEQGRHNFFRLLADEYDHDDAEVDAAIQGVLSSNDLDSRRGAEEVLAHSLRPKRDHLLRRFVGLEGGLPFLVDLREELLVHRRSDGAMTAVDNDLRAILEAWFDLALLRLERLTWQETPAALLEKLIEYEAVHTIESWDDLRGRLATDRRCYGFMHSMMPGEPLIFVEVALTKGIATSLEPLLDHEAERSDPADADTAIFYSISNCHRGLAGVSLGDLLIKRVVQQLTAELPNLTNFATLSPIPGFRNWLIRSLAENHELLTPDEVALISEDSPALARSILRDLVSCAVLPPKSSLAPLQPVLLRLAAVYLARTTRGARAFDPVAHFHLSNGARIERLNWWANPSQTGWERGLCIMVNYRYVLKDIESDHDAYIGTGQIKTSDDVGKLLG